MAEKKINGTTYRVDRIPAPEAIHMKVRIGKVIGAGMGDMAMAVIGAAAGDEGVRQGADAAILSGIGHAFEKCDPDEVVQLASDIVGKAQIKTESGDWADVDLESDLTDRPADLYPLMGFVLKEALGAFFPAGAASRLAQMKAH